jgi:biopolymer transport protein ExbD
MRALRVARAEDTRVFVRADATVPYGAVASALADVTGAGFTKVALVNQPGGNAADGGSPA